MNLIRTHKIRSCQIYKTRFIDSVRCHDCLLSRTAKLDLQLSCVRIQAGHKIRPLICKHRHLTELFNPYILVDTFNPLGTDQFLLTLTRIDSMLRDQKPAAVFDLRHTTEYTGITGRNAVVEIRLGQIHLECVKKRQIHGAHRPQKIREQDFRIADLIAFQYRLKEILPHQKIIERKFLLVKQMYQRLPIHILIEKQAFECLIFLII